ncbi:MAG TPA: CoA pyrophosphatase [Gemmatimonadales bacterium]|nr:CoA pyrophosphatase [Gemmatimonadales bacterium]
MRKSLLDRAREVLRKYRPTEIPATGEMISAAVAIMLREGDDGIEALFIHRAVRAGDTWSGQIAFPGGRREPRDTDLADTAIRETHEEIGVDLTGAERLGVLDDLYPRTPVLPPVVVRPFVFALTSRPPIVLSQEVQDAFWVSFRSLATPGVRGEITVAHPGIPPRVLPAYTLGKHVIWGMSERILTPLISLIS